MHRPIILFKSTIGSFKPRIDQLFYFKTGPPFAIVNIEYCSQISMHAYATDPFWMSSLSARYCRYNRPGRLHHRRLHCPPCIYLDTCRWYAANWRPDASRPGLDISISREHRPLYDWIHDAAGWINQGTELYKWEPAFVGPLPPRRILSRLRGKNQFSDSKAGKRWKKIIQKKEKWNLWKPARKWPILHAGCRFFIQRGWQTMLSCHQSYSSKNRTILITRI